MRLFSVTYSVKGIVKSELVKAPSGTMAIKSIVDELGRNVVFFKFIHINLI